MSMYVLCMRGVPVKTVSKLHRAELWKNAAPVGEARSFCTVDDGDPPPRIVAKHDALADAIRKFLDDADATGDSETREYFDDLASDLGERLGATFKIDKWDFYARATGCENK